jgi:hypothetical protein
MTAPISTSYTSRLLKGGAVLDDTRRVVDLWDMSISPGQNLERISLANLLGKASRSRAEDVIFKVIRPRFVDPGDHVIPALKGLLEDHRAFTEACYFEASRADALLAAFAEGPLWCWWHQGRVGVGPFEVEDWLQRLAHERKAPDWTGSVRGRVAQGLLTTLRDFRILTGVTRGRRKEIAAPDMSPRGFAYVAWREHERGASSRALVASTVWRRWLLDPDRVVDLFGHAARLGLLRFSSAGSSVRIDWLVHTLAEVTGAAA